MTMLSADLAHLANQLDHFRRLGVRLGPDALGPFARAIEKAADEARAMEAGIVPAGARPVFGEKVVPFRRPAGGIRPSSPGGDAA